MAFVSMKRINGALRPMLSMTDDTEIIDYVRSFFVKEDDEDLVEIRRKKDQQIKEIRENYELHRATNVQLAEQAAHYFLKEIEDPTDEDKAKAVKIYQDELAKLDKLLEDTLNQGSGAAEIEMKQLCLDAPTPVLPLDN